MSDGLAGYFKRSFLPRKSTSLSKVKCGTFEGSMLRAYVESLPLTQSLLRFLLFVTRGKMMDVSVSQLARLSVSLPAELLNQLDAMVKKRRLPSRSQMIAELIRHELAGQSEQLGVDTLAGTITLVYQADNTGARQALMDTQTDYLKEVIASQHVFLEDGKAMEVMLVQGPGERLTRLCDDLRRVKAIKQLTLVTTTALLPPLHHHSNDRASHGKKPRK